MDNKEIVRRAFEEAWTNLDVLDELIDESYVGHDPAASEPFRGIQGAKDNVEMYRAAFEGAQVKVLRQIAEGEYVATRWEGRGRHTGDLMGIPPTGKEVVVTGQTCSRVVNGKIVAEQSNWDTLGMLQQLGAIPAMEAAEAR